MTSWLPLGDRATCFHGRSFTGIRRHSPVGLSSLIALPRSMASTAESRGASVSSGAVSGGVTSVGIPEITAPAAGRPSTSRGSHFCWISAGSIAVSAPVGSGGVGADWVGVDAAGGRAGWESPRPSTTAPRAIMLTTTATPVIAAPRRIDVRRPACSSARSARSGLATRSVARSRRSCNARSSER